MRNSTSAEACTGDTVIASALYFDRMNGTVGVLDRPGGVFIFTFNTTTRQFMPEAVFEGENNADSFGECVTLPSCHPVMQF